MTISMKHMTKGSEQNVSNISISAFDTSVDSYFFALEVFEPNLFNSTKRVAKPSLTSRDDLYREVRSSVQTEHWTVQTLTWDHVVNATWSRSHLV